MLVLHQAHALRHLTVNENELESFQKHKLCSTATGAKTMRVNYVMFIIDSSPRCEEGS